MIELRKEKSNYLSTYSQVGKRLSGQTYPWVQSIRAEAVERFDRLGFPTTRQEEWKYTSVAPIVKVPFKPARLQRTRVAATALANVSFVRMESILLVFVDGHYAEELSSFQSHTKGVKAGSLKAAFDSEPALLEQHLARHATYEENAFTALNTAFMEDGGFVFVPPGMTVKEPIHLLFISTSPENATVTYPRNLIVVGPAGQATVIESYASLNGGVYFTNAVTEIVAGDSSCINHYKLQRESEEAFHIASTRVHQSRSSSYSCHSFSIGGSLVRNDINVVLDADGAECSLNGLFITGGSQHVDNHTSIDHAKPHCNSRELYKGILDGKSTGVFNGKIIVRPDSQKTNASQTNKNLLLSERALVDTKPQLEIFADDVKCTHGATIGQLDEEGLFYLRSRGIDELEARNLLTYAFASEMADCVKVEPVRCFLNKILHKRVPQAEKIGGTL